jgi:hypothetical protein
VLNKKSSKKHQSANLINTISEEDNESSSDDDIYGDKAEDVGHMILQAYTDVNMMKVHIGSGNVDHDDMHSDDNAIRDGR